MTEPSGRAGVRENINTSTTPIVPATTNHTIQNGDSKGLRGNSSGAQLSSCSGWFSSLTWRELQIESWRASGGPPMVIPPLEQQHREGDSRDGPPQFHVRALQ